LATRRDVEQFVALNNERDFVVVGYFEKSSKPSQLHSSFLISAGKMRDDVSFGIVTDAAVAKAMNVDGAEAVIAYKNFDDKRTVYGGGTKSSHLQDWITTNSLPVVGEFNGARTALCEA